MWLLTAPHRKAPGWCEEFLCPGCFEDHQWFFKKRSHEARKVEELRAESAHRFLEGTKKSCTLFCSSHGHTEQGHITRPPNHRSSLSLQQEEPTQRGSPGIVPTFTISLGDMQVSMVERGSQASPKVLKLEHNATADPSEPSSTQRDSRGEPSTSATSHNCSSVPKAGRSHADDAEDNSIIISSEDSEEDTVGSGAADSPWALSE
ncbi:Putative transcription factor PML [Anas platyrhynchos]|uniref:Putative transcription factor PML n=1 Tax=Anas platyrhynchos TaxID=8839 RepID=R0L360_ANAPL|nr:Putative transcription factor PML [Anas platyrhynchos]